MYMEEIRKDNNVIIKNVITNQLRNRVGKSGNERLFLLPLLILQKQAEVQTFVRKINDDLTVSISSTISFMAFSNCTSYIIAHTKRFGQITLQ
jgi:hypothetical protein